MKLKLVCAIIISFMLIPSAFADVSNKTLDSDTTTVIGDQEIKPSKNVKLIFSSTQTAYTAASWNINGRNKYATTQDDDIKKTECSTDPCGDSEVNSVTAGTMPW